MREFFIRITEVSRVSHMFILGAVHVYARRSAGNDRGGSGQVKISDREGIRFFCTHILYFPAHRTYMRCALNNDTEAADYCYYYHYILGMSPRQ